MNVDPNRTCLGVSSWWNMHKEYTLELQIAAIWVMSKVCGNGACERSLSNFVHGKKCDRLRTKRANNRVHVFTMRLMKTSRAFESFADLVCDKQNKEDSWCA